jgi:hypothetical protein
MMQVCLGEFTGSAGMGDPFLHLPAPYLQHQLSLMRKRKVKGVKEIE